MAWARGRAGSGGAAKSAGAIWWPTGAVASRLGHRGAGTEPHGRFTAFAQDTVAASLASAGRFGDEMNVTVLVDFENHSVRTALEVADALGERLWGVRLDTSELMVDRSLESDMGDFKPTGVNEVLVRRVRDALDAAGHVHVHIVVSGGFDAEKIESFERAGAPVDAYGVGSPLIRGSNDFTADVVMVEGRPCAKVGRRFVANERMEQVA